MGIAVYTKEFRTAVAADYLGQDLIAMLINAPQLGLGEIPTKENINDSINLTMQEAASLEVGNSKGYKRFIVTLEEPTYDEINKRAIFNVTSKFIAKGGSIGPFTHLCYATQTNLNGATDANGNNAGDTQGILVKVEPVDFAPNTIAENVFYTHVTQFIVSTRIFS